jgi:hypothetical protein
MFQALYVNFNHSTQIEGGKKEIKTLKTPLNMYMYIKLSGVYISSYISCVPFFFDNQG